MRNEKALASRRVDHLVGLVVGSRKLSCWLSFVTFELEQCTLPASPVPAIDLGAAKSFFFLLHF